jgi:acetyltransferase-like isoleucine patch superfamily enzyme
MVISMLRFLGMHAPIQSMRVAMYKKAGVKIGNVFTFGSNIFIDVGRKAEKNAKDLVDVTIGDDVLLAGYIHILTHSSVLWGIKDEGGSVVIKDGARVGIGVTILPGVTIGKNAAIGACSLVNRDIPDNCIAVGVPAKPIKRHHFHKHELCRNFDPSEMVKQVDSIDERTNK